ncbi:MAG TPA: deoxyribose-phosphate aldolase [Clostridia bacterium]|nr:deoxyribose-phosphate aldolase [Clostridia bacterium]
MPVTEKQLAAMTDGVITSVLITRQELLDFLDFTKKCHLRSVIGPRCYTALIREKLNASGTLLSSECSDSNGADATHIKIYTAQHALQLGADEIEMRMNFGYLRSGMYQEVVQDIRAVRNAVGGHILKCAIEAPLLSYDEIIKACDLAVEGGADFVSSSTGESGETTAHQIKIISDAVGGRAKIKAAGGIRTLAQIDEFASLGVECFGIAHNMIANLISAASNRS